MRITFKGEAESLLSKVSKDVDLSPTQLLMQLLFSYEKELNNTTHIEEVTNELYKPHKGSLQDRP